MLDSLLLAAALAVPYLASWEPWGGTQDRRPQTEVKHAATPKAHAGATLTGQVIDEDGVGRAAEVQFNMNTESDAAARTKTKTGPDGFFRFSVKAPASSSSGPLAGPLAGPFTGRLVAISENNGLATLPNVTLESGRMNADFRLVLAGDGAIAGTVRSAAGVPIAGLPLVVVGVGAELQHGRSLNSVLAATEPFDVPGLMAAYCFTDVDGRFLARGLRAGIEFDVRLDRGTLFQPSLWSSTMEPGPALTPETVPADGRSVDVHFERLHLVVEVLDAEGLPSALEVKGATPTLMGPGLPAAWPDHPFVIVMPAELGPKGPLVAERGKIEALRGLSAGPGAISFRIERDQTYFVSVIGRSANGRLYSGRPMLVRLDGGQERVVLRVEPSSPELSLGQVDVSFAGETFKNLEDSDNAPDGKPIPIETFSYGSVLNTVEDPDTGVTLLVSSFHWGWPEADGQLQLPEGRYRLATRILATRWGTMRDIHGEGAELVEVRARQRARTTIEAGPLSRVRGRFQPRQGLSGGRVKLWLRNASGERRALTRIVERRFPDVSMSSEWPKAVSCTSAWFPTGTYDLVGQIDDGPMVVLKTITTEPWKTLEVEL